MKAFLRYIFVGAICLIIADQAMAKDLVDAAQAAQSMFNSIGVAAIGIAHAIQRTLHVCFRGRSKVWI